MTTTEHRPRLIDGDRALARLRALIEQESPTGDAPGIEACLQLIEAWVEPLLGRAGERRVVDGVTHLFWPAVAPSATLLLCHVDTVWPRGTLAGWPVTERDGRLTGPGAFDMKAGIVAAIDAIELLADRSTVSLLITSDEEQGSLTSRALVEEAASRAEAVLVMEPSLDGAVKIARRGGSIYRLVAEGVAAHAGLEPELGANALIEIAHQVLAVGQIADAAVGTTVTPTVASAGTTVNTVPAHAELRLDVRAWTVEELERVDERIRAIQPVDERVRLHLHGGINRPPLEEARALALFSLACEVAASARLPPVECAAVGGASDGNFTGALGIPTLDGLGPLGHGAHAPHEWVDPVSMSERSVLVAGLIERIAKDPARSSQTSPPATPTTHPSPDATIDHRGATAHDQF